MVNEFPGKTESWLLEKLAAVNSALDGGSQTGVGIAPGIRHEFAALNPAQLRQRREEYKYSLWCLDATTYSDWGPPPGITRPRFC